MKLPVPLSLRNSLIGVVILSLCMMPLLGMGMHIHLAEIHMGHDLHGHDTETHGFHLHKSSHDNIDIDAQHLSDTQQIDIEQDSRLNKVFKLLALFSLVVIFLTGFVTARAVTLSDYAPPLRDTFEIFNSLLRGPPAV